jgi:O-glycosyl hydrolase
MTSGLWLADTVYQDVAVIGDAQFDWWTALSSQLGCQPIGHPSCLTAVNGSGWNDGLLYYDPAYAHNGNYAISTTKRYYVLGNFSRYVRPGAVRHTAAGAPPGVHVLAFEKDGDWSVVVINDGQAGSVPTRVGIRLPEGASARPTNAVRTSATDNLAAVSLPHAAHGIAIVPAPAQSVSTYTFGG